MAQKTKLIVGLGNVGQAYVGTRHNIGFSCLDYYAAEHLLVWQEKPKFKAIICEATYDQQVHLVYIKPTTFMNLSGQAVKTVRDFYKIENDQILVVHDELDLPFGTIRVRQGGSHAGNNGIKSISEMIGEDYLRIRCGIANEHSANQAAETFVLGKFTKDEADQLEGIKQQVTHYLNEFTTDTLKVETARLKSPYGTQSYGDTKSAQ